MKFVDRNGKLFGKLNLLDAIIILLFLFLIFAGIYKLAFVDNSVYIPDYKQGEITIQLNNLLEYEAKAFEDGDLVAVPKIQNLGKISNVKIEARTETIASADGSVYTVQNPLYYTAIITIQSNEMVEREGEYFVGKNYKVIAGQTLDISTGVVSSKANVRSVSLIEN